MNEGKKFEDDFKKSVPPDTWKYRFKDGTASWDGGDNARFQHSNICDFELYNQRLYLFELKSHMGKSLPHDVFKNSKGEVVHLYDLADAMNYGIAAGALINMREVGETYFLYADTVLDHIITGDRKSIPLEYMRMNGYRVKAEKKRTRWRYDLKDLLDKIRLDR